jgi:1,4-alpha-glucan branching enzyme
VRENWIVELKGHLFKQEIFNSNALEFGGTGDVFNPALLPVMINKKEKIYQLTVHLPALGAVVLK